MKLKSKIEALSFLGLSKDATENEITKAYKRLAVRYHPDKTGKTDNSEMQQLNEARELALGLEEEPAIPSYSESDTPAQSSSHERDLFINQSVEKIDLYMERVNKLIQINKTRGGGDSLSYDSLGQIVAEFKREGFIEMYIPINMKVAEFRLLLLSNKDSFQQSGADLYTIFKFWERVFYRAMLPADRGPTRGPTFDVLKMAAELGYPLAVYKIADSILTTSLFNNTNKTSIETALECLRSIETLIPTLNNEDEKQELQTALLEIKDRLNIPALPEKGSNEEENLIKMVLLTYKMHFNNCEYKFDYDVQKLAFFNEKGNELESAPAMRN